MQRLLRFAGQLDHNEIRLRIKIVFARCIDYPDVPLFFGLLIRERLINLAFFQIFAVLILNAEDKSIIFP